MSVAVPTDRHRAAMGSTVADVVAAWREGPARSAGPLTGFRLFSRQVAHRVPVPGTAPVVQVHVPVAAASGHARLVALLGRRNIRSRFDRLRGVGVATHLRVGSTARWIPDPADPGGNRTVVPPGAPGTVSVVEAIVLRLASTADLYAVWALLDETGDDLYGQQVLDRTAHLPRGVDGPTGARPVGEIHLTDRRGRRLVHLTTSAGEPPTTWVAARDGRFDLHHWLTWRPDGAASRLAGSGVTR